MSIRGSLSLVTSPKPESLANQCFSRGVRWQPLFAVKTDAGSIGNVVDAAGVDSAITNQSQFLRTLPSIQAKHLPDRGDQDRPLMPGLNAHLIAE